MPPTVRVTPKDEGDAPSALNTPDTDTDSDPVATSTALAFTPDVLLTVNHSSRLPARHDLDVVPIGGEKLTTAEVLVGDEKLTTTTSPALNPGITGGGLKAIADTTPGQHAADPVVLLPNRPHVSHDAILVAAAAGLNLPAGHATQAVADTVPSWAEYRPVGHGCRGPPSQ